MKIDLSILEDVIFRHYGYDSRVIEDGFFIRIRVKLSLRIVFTQFLSTVRISKQNCRRLGTVWLVSSAYMDQIERKSVKCD